MATDPDRDDPPETTRDHLVRDPVCGMRFPPEKAAATLEHEGQTFYFCSTGCKERFEAAPDHFLGGSVGAVKANFFHALGNLRRLVRP